MTVANISSAELAHLRWLNLSWMPQMNTDPLELGQYLSDMLANTPFALEESKRIAMAARRGSDFFSYDIFDCENPRFDKTTIWRAIVLRMNAGVELLALIMAELNKTDNEIYQLHENPDAWMRENWEANLAALLHEKGGVFQTAHERLGTAKLRRDIVPVMREMRPIDPEAKVCYERLRELTAGAQAVKRFLAGHLQAITALMRNNHQLDVDCVRTLALYPVTEFAEGAMCAENMECTASRLENVDFLFPNPNCRQTLFEWTMAHVRPASVHIMDFVSRIHTAITSSEEYTGFVFECLTATLCGLYPHSREFGSLHTWIDCHWWRQASPSNQIGALDRYLSTYGGTTVGGAARAETEERLFFVALRERFVHDCQIALGLQLHILCQYDAQPQFEVSVVSHCDRIREALRDGAGQYDDEDDPLAMADRPNSKYASITITQANHQAKINSLGMMQTWHTFHQASTNTFDFLATCFAQTDLLVIVNECIKEGKSLPADHFKPPEDLLRSIGDYILENVPTYGQFEKAWLTDLGVTSKAARFMAMTVEQHRSGSLTSASGQAGIQQLFRFGEFDYALCSIIFQLLATHRRNRIIPLDAHTAIRQCRAIAERPDLAISQSSCHSIVSSMQCCNSLKTLVVQTHGACTGSEPTRYNFTTGEHTCRAGKTGQYTSARNAEKIGARNTIPNAFEAYNRYRAQAEISPEVAIANEGELREAEATLRAVLRMYAQTVAKSRLRISCDNSFVRFYPAIGYAFEQHSTQPESVSCTVCPLCGNKTRFNTKLFGVNGFSCGHCQPYIAEEYAELTKPACGICNIDIVLCDQASKATGLDKATRQWTAEKMVVDDISVPGAAFPRKILICSICNVRWLREANNYLTLSEIKHWTAHPLNADTLLTNIVELPQLDTFVTELELLRNQLSRPMPKIGQATDLQKVITKRTGVGNFRFNVTLHANVNPGAIQKGGQAEESP